VLGRNPSTGYELAARLATPVSYFWTARHSQIHPELQRLPAGGLVVFVAVPGPEPKGKKVYSITPEGFEPLRNGWPSRPRSAGARRAGAQTCAAWVADPGELLAVFHRQLHSPE
jgi:DNA-binding PadR family transcriptional regulator